MVKVRLGLSLHLQCFYEAYCILIMRYYHICHRRWANKVANLKIYGQFCSHSL